MTGGQLLTLDEAAERLGVHYMTAYRYVRTGRLRAVKVGRIWQVDSVDVDALGGGGPGAVSGPKGDAATRFEARLLAGDEAGAWTVVEEELVNGREPAEVMVGIIATAMGSIGARWDRGEVTVVDEHLATTIATRVIARLGPQFARRGLARGVVVLGAPAGDHHALPTAIVRDLLRGEHFDVVDLGADVPADSWAEASASAGVSSPSLVAVGIAVSTADNERAVSGAIDAIRSVTAAPIVVGGVAAVAFEAAQSGVMITASALDAVAFITSLV
ncbi:B12-binding domain-containing protein [Aquihabitans sp. McL0605]|uniref:B12-binding domain-containing protein n=1 Tax=Aquihabitans sp. McL0605 TaxID=3415671 RepID=UPI003CEFE812